MSIAGPYVAFSRWNSVPGELIRDFTGGDVNHCLFLFRSVDWQCWMTLGANANGFTPEPLADFADVIVDIWEPKQGTLWKGLLAHRDWLNRPYDYAGLLGMSVVEVAEHLAKRRVKNPFLNEKELFCSEAGKLICVASGYEVGAFPPGETDPNELDTAIGQSGLMNRIEKSVLLS